MPDRDSGTATVLDDLPGWLVVEEILVRLPPKDVLRCRAVRKSWRAGTSTDKFILDHHRRQPSLPIIQHMQGIYCLAAAGEQRIRPVLRYTPPCAVFTFRVAHQAACDGLLIVSREYTFYICNPATRKCASLPHPPTRPGFSAVSVVAFYRHHMSGEHRVIWMLNHDHTAQYPDFYVLTVGSDHPRGIQWPEDSARWFHHCSRYPGHSPVHHRGSLHWALNVDITVFDTVTETFRKMSRPAQLGHMVSLLHMAGDLALYHLTGDGEIDLWVLQDYDAETWSLRYRINFLEMEAFPPLNLEVKGIRSVAVINERELLIKHYPDRLLHCDVDGVFLGNVERVERQFGLSLTGYHFKESMISLPLFEMQQEDAEPPFIIVL